MITGKARAMFRDGKTYVFGIHDGKLKAVDTGVIPYFFVKEVYRDKVEKFKEVSDVVETDLKYRNEYGREFRVVRVECPRSNDVSKVRSMLEKKCIETYEADILYHRRNLIDKAIEVDYSTSACYLDIELDDSHGFPKEYGATEIVSVAVYDQRGNGEWFYIGDYDSEREFLEVVVSHLQDNEKTIMCGWNVEFDYMHLKERCERLGVENKIWLGFSTFYDLYGEYKSRIKGLESYTLEEVSDYEGFRKKHRDKAIHEMTRQELEEYNMYDAELCYLIDKKYGFFELQAEITREVNTIFDESSPVVMADVLVIRRLRELGYVAKNSRVVGNEQSYRGAFVKEPIAGVHRYVGYFDFASMYPNIIIHNRIDIDGFDGEVVPAILRKFLDLRAEYKGLYKQKGDKKYDVKQKVFKVLANSMYGVFGNKYWRYKNYKKAETVTGKGRELFKRLEDFVEQYGLQVVYGDTDAVFVKLDKAKNVEAFAKLIEDEINDVLAPFSVKLEAIFDKIIFFSAGNKAVKKRYIGMTIDGDWVWRGVEKRRSDWCRLAKVVQEEVVKMILVEGKGKDEVYEYLADIKKRLFEGEFDEMLVVAKSYKDLEEYKTNQPHVRALRKALEKNIPLQGKISYVWVGDDVEPLGGSNSIEKFKRRLNYTYYWSNVIYPPVKRIIEAVWGSRQQKLWG